MSRRKRIADMSPAEAEAMRRYWRLKRQEARARDPELDNAKVRARYAANPEPVNARCRAYYARTRKVALATSSGST